MAAFLRCLTVCEVNAWLSIGTASIMHSCHRARLSLHTAFIMHGFHHAQLLFCTAFNMRTFHKAHKPNRSHVFTTHFWVVNRFLCHGMKGIGTGRSCVYRTVIRVYWDLEQVRAAIWHPLLRGTGKLCSSLSDLGFMGYKRGKSCTFMW